MSKAKEATASIPGEAVKVVAAVGEAEQEAKKASTAADAYRKKLNDANKKMKDILIAMDTKLIAAKKAEELAKKALSDGKKEVTDTDHNALEKDASDGLEAVLKGLKTKTEEIFSSITEPETEAKAPMDLLQAAMKRTESAVTLANVEKSAAEAALQQANKDLEAAEKKQKESEKQKEGILESEGSERDGEKGLTRPHQPDTTDGTATPPAGALLPKTDGTADGEKLLAQHTDGSDVPAWERAPLMLLLMACVAVL
ncbi:hypothetical protein DQ04_11661020 [Trypanosoma grayi]|uniref:hypothetical protein n=1 Tax=Trypanosoma grayi TaxID=71804 RepID=UPI0004F4709E|nr:hypothetical protein DQ04_11661020 [Trypanosoma grayi]KEG06919.1 hypothetical protein DQ04_11661020 [Trypanosoma grayi]